MGGAAGCAPTGGRSAVAALAAGIAMRTAADTASNPALKRQTRARRFMLHLLQPINEGSFLFPEEAGVCSWVSNQSRAQTGGGGPRGSAAVCGAWASDVGTVPAASRVGVAVMPGPAQGGG